MHKLILIAVMAATPHFATAQDEVRIAQAAQVQSASGHLPAWSRVMADLS
ncbi:MAG: hypothetical protein ABIU09_00155 [Pyrinomonadaceae bacterium]